MFLIAGISPKTIVLDNNPRRCSLCGANQAYLKRMDHYISLFFIPLFRVKKGNPVIICDNCERSPFQMRDDNVSDSGRKGERCRHCGKSVAGDFKYCPYCGQRI